MATIITKNSGTASSVPTGAQLTAGELAVNTADKRLFTKNGGGTVIELGTNPSSLTLPNGTANGVPYLNASKVLTSGSALTFDGATFGLTGNETVSGYINLTTTTGQALYFGGTTSALAVYGNKSTNTLSLYTNGAAQVNVDGSGNLGLGVTPSAWGTSEAIQFIAGMAFGRRGHSQNTYYDGTNFRAITTGFSSLYQQSSGGHFWYSGSSATAGAVVSFTQAMTLDSSGNLLVGTTSRFSSERLTVNSSAGPAIATGVSSTASIFQILFCNPNGGVGSVTTSGTSTAFNTSSDYRLKENVAPMTGALAKVAALKPVTYTWKADGSAGEGFIAHELAEVCPAAVTGEKDAVDAEGKPVYQGIDTSFLVATLTAAIQEQQAIIAALTDRITALEAK